MEDKKCDNCDCCNGDCECNHHFEMSKDILEKKKEFLQAKIKHIDEMLKNTKEEKK